MHVSSHTPISTQSLSLALALIGASAMLLSGHAGVVGNSLLPHKAAWLCFALGSGILLLAACHSRGAGRFGLAAMALFAGGAADLWITAPRYFNVVMAGPDPEILALLAFQAVVVLVMLWQSRAEAALLVRSAGYARLAAIAMAAILLSVSFLNFARQDAYASYIKQVAFSTAIIGLSAANVLALIAQPSPKFLMRYPSPALFAPLAFVLAALLAWLGFEFAPHVEDEVAYLFHARTFLDGSLAAPLPPESIRPGLEYYLFDMTNRGWFSVTTPGWPAALALAEAAGMPWLLNPLLAALCVWLTFVLTDRLADRRTAQVAAALVGVSPWFLGAAGALMPHLVSLTAVLAAWVLLSGPARNRIWAFLLAGAFMGYLFTVRQLEGVLLGGLTGLILLARARSPAALMRVAAYGLGCIAVGGLYLAYNAAITGSPMVPPLKPYLDVLWSPGANDYGFGPNRGASWLGLDIALGHSLREGLINAWHAMTVLQFEYLGWGIGSVALSASALLSRNRSRSDMAAAALCLLVIVVHIPYWASGTFYIGPRYWFGLFLPLTFLSARGAIAIIDAANIRLQQDMRPALWVLMLFSMCVFLTWQGAEKYHGYGGYDASLTRMARAADHANSIVVYQGDADPGSLLVLNRPSLPADRPIYLKATPELDLNAVGADYPDRPIVLMK